MFNKYEEYLITFTRNVQIQNTPLYPKNKRTKNNKNILQTDSTEPISVLWIDSSTFPLIQKLKLGTNPMNLKQQVVYEKIKEIMKEEDKPSECTKNQHNLTTPLAN